MRTRQPRSRGGRTILALLLVGAASLTGIATADAAPWGTSGADYTGVLCRLGATDVPMGAWTVNGTVPAFATADITGTDVLQQPAPVSGTPSAMTPGQAGFSQADIGAVAYLLAQHQNGSAAELAELSADVALVAGSGQIQSRCLGQSGTSAARAADRLTEARRYAGPYSVRVAAPTGAIPGSDAGVTVTVRSASGTVTPGLPVSVTAGATSATVVTGRDGVARTSVAVPAAAAVAVTATVQVPTALVYLDTSPPSVTLGPPTTVTGTGSLQPVLHPTPAVSVSAADLVLSSATIRPVANVTGTFGYSGTGDITLLGPVRATGSCGSVPGATLAAAAAAWQDTFTFRGDAQYRAQPSPALGPGCYGIRATVTVTNSSPPERARSAVVPLTVSTLQLTSSAAAAAGPPGGLAATVTGTDPGRTSVTTTVTARGPVPADHGACPADFARAPIAGTSSATALRRDGSRLRAVVTVPAIRQTGCYAITARSEVTLDGDTATGSADPVTMAILQPAVLVATDAVSAESGRPTPGTVQVSGTYGFPGVVAVGVVAGSTIPISGCVDAAYPADSKPAVTTAIRTTADAEYRFRAPVPARGACYALTATFTLTGNAAVTATADARDDTTVFLAGIRPDTKRATVVQTTSSGGVGRAVVTLLVTVVLMLAGCTTLFVRTYRRERTPDDAAGGWPLLDDDPAPRPMPG